MNCKYTKKIKKEEEFNNYLELLRRLSPLEKSYMFDNLLYLQGVEYYENYLSKELCDNESFQMGYKHSLAREKIDNQ